MASGVEGKNPGQKTQRLNPLQQVTLFWETRFRQWIPNRDEARMQSHKGSTQFPLAPIVVTAAGLAAVAVGEIVIHEVQQAQQGQETGAITFDNRLFFVSIHQTRQQLPDGTWTIKTVYEPTLNLTQNDVYTGSLTSVNAPRNSSEFNGTAIIRDSVGNFEYVDTNSSDLQRLLADQNVRLVALVGPEVQNNLTGESSKVDALHGVGIWYAFVNVDANGNVIKNTDGSIPWASAQELHLPNANKFAAGPLRVAAGSVNTIPNQLLQVQTPSSAEAGIGQTGQASPDATVKIAPYILNRRGQPAR